MTEPMTSRERLLTAMTGGTPDRVPCTPDFSNMIPCRLTGKPFWDIYLNDDPPLWRAYIAAAEHFGIDAWFPYGQLDYQWPDTVRHEHEIVSRTAERIVRRTRTITPDGELTSETTFLVGDPPSPTENPVKDLREQFAIVRHLFREPTGYTTETARMQKAELGEKHAFAAGVGTPGFQAWVRLCVGGIEPLAYAAADCPELLDEMYELNERAALRQTEMIIDSGLFDYVLVGMSGGITLGSPDLFDRYCLPAIAKITRLCRQAGLPTMLHCCGKEMHLVARCVERTDLDCVNPLEVPPMGDCDLAEVKRLYGGRIALMGNLHTTDVMLRGSVEFVKAAARKAIDDAAKGGGFILSTGDQCGRDTPDANLFALVEVCKTYGRY